MFTGIVEELGEAKGIAGRRGLLELSIKAEKVREDLKKGDSLALNGVCLTVTNLERDTFKVEVISETLRRTTLKELKVGDKLNLERALRVDERLGGHIISGHIDGVGTIRSEKQKGKEKIMEIVPREELLKYIVPQGSVALEGVSLTVGEQKDDSFTVSLIPYTLENTNLGFKKGGDRLNLEVDILGKYVEKLLRPKRPKGIERETLKEYGYL
jgi:riboflavin synthase